VWTDSNRRRSWRGPAAVLLTSIALVVAGGCAGPRTLCVMTYNIHHGEGTDGRLDLERIAAVINRHQPDILALQEVDRCTRRAGGVDQAAELGRLTGMHAAFGAAMPYQGGEYGEAILARWAPSETKTHALRHSTGREPRAALVARWSATETPDADAPPFAFAIIATHLDHLPDATDRLMQVADIASLATDLDGPVLLMGDLNAEPDTAEIGRLRATWRDCAAGEPQKTYPSREPNIRIDYVFARPAEHWRVVRTEAIEELVASDHRPLLVVLETVE